jgi:hypothetical protein
VNIKRGLKCLAFALLTAAIFAVSVYGFIAVATAPGYLAVMLFLGSIVALAVAFTLLYALGIIAAGRSGDGK